MRTFLAGLTLIFGGAVLCALVKDERVIMLGIAMIVVGIILWMIRTGAIDALLSALVGSDSDADW